LPTSNRSCLPEWPADHGDAQGSRNGLLMRRIEILKNVSSSWFGLGVNILVGIFLSPFILHRLGDTAYGIWILIFSVTGYYGLFDLGIRSSVIRYVSTFTATNDQEGLAKLINTSLATYATIGVVAMVVTLVS